MKNNLPEGWTIAKVEDVAFTASGGTPSTRRKEYWQDGNVPWINSGTLKDGLITKPSHFITELGLKNSSAKLFPKNSVVIALTGATTGRVGILDFECSANQSVTALYPSNLNNPKFLFYFLLHSRDAIVGLSLGSAQPHINKFIVDNLEIPIPPLAEQQRIVTKLDAVMRKVEANKKRLDKIPKLLKRFRQSVLAAAVSGKLTEEWRRRNGVDDEWEEVNIGSITTLITSGSRGWAKYYAESGSTFVRAQNINQDILDLTDIAFVQLPNGREGIRTLIQEGDILITITGANVTKTAYVGYDIKDAYVSQHVGLVRVKKSINSRFVWLFLVSETHGRKQLLASAYGQGKPQLNLDNIKDVLISMPLIEEQKEIVRIADQLFAFADKLEARYTKAKLMLARLPQSILAKAFRGELVAQDPKDEHASVLLERIRDEKVKLADVKKGKTKFSSVPVRSTRDVLIKAK